jgi:D-glycero-D-manno-heptose 1,7-bisphosphate phosphatase
MPPLRPAVFLDRDGTLIEDVPYLGDLAQVRVLPGVIEALRLLQRAGFACVVTTNQSAVGRGMITDEQRRLVHEELERQLAVAGIRLDGHYYCTEAPCGSDRTVIEHVDRKPGPGMLLQAARDLHLNLSQSWIVGDQFSDMLAGRNAGCKCGILVRGPNLAVALAVLGDDWLVADDLLAAARKIIELSVYV